MTNTKQVACLAPALLSALVLHGCGTPGDEDIYRCGSWDPDTDNAELCQNAGNCVYTSGVAVACQNPDQQSDPTAANAVLGNQEFCDQIDGATWGHFCVSSCNRMGQSPIPTLTYENARKQKLPWVIDLDEVNFAGVRASIKSIPDLLTDMLPWKITYQQLVAAPPEKNSNVEEWAPLSSESGKRCTAYFAGKSDGSVELYFKLTVKVWLAEVTLFDYTDCIPKGGNSANLPVKAKIPEAAWDNLKIVKTNNKIYNLCKRDTESPFDSTSCAISNRAGDLFCADPPSICKQINDVEEAKRDIVCAQNDACEYDESDQSCKSKSDFPACDAAQSQQCPGYCEDSGAENICTLPNSPDGFCAPPDAFSVCERYFDAMEEIQDLPGGTEALCLAGAIPATCTDAPL